MFQQLDNSAHLTEIRDRVAPLAGYHFSHGQRVNAPGGCYPVRGVRPGIPNNPTCPDVRGPEAYFTSSYDAEQYAHMVNDLLWLLGEYRRLTECMAAYI